jgi:Ser/Thr protein kinase RdoA (MazF antagonist)
VPNTNLQTELTDAPGLGRTLQSLHGQLRQFTGELGNLDELHGRIERLLLQLRPVDAHGVAMISALKARLDALVPVVFKSDLPSQALHGDVSLGNLLRLPDRWLWNDFEDTFRGPVNWDLAGFVGSLHRQGASSSFVQEMLEGYGWRDGGELVPWLAAQDVYDDIWRMYQLQRRWT